MLQQLAYTSREPVVIARDNRKVIQLVPASQEGVSANTLRKLLQKNPLSLAEKSAYAKDVSEIRKIALERIIDHNWQ